jgi:hypothetical protein
MSSFEQAAARYRRLQFQYLCTDDPREKDRLYELAQDALGDVWMTEPPAGTSAVNRARFGVTLARSERLNRSNDDGAESEDNWHGVDVGFDLVRLLQAILEDIVDQLGGSGDVLPIHRRPS